MHSLHMQIFLCGAKIGGSKTLDYPLRAEKNFEFFCPAHPKVKIVAYGKNVHLETPQRISLQKGMAL